MADVPDEKFLIAAHDAYRRILWDRPAWSDLDAAEVLAWEAAVQAAIEAMEPQRRVDPGALPSTWIPRGWQRPLPATISPWCICYIREDVVPDQTTAEFHVAIFDTSPTEKKRLPCVTRFDFGPFGDAHDAEAGCCDLIREITRAVGCTQVWERWSNRVRWPARLRPAVDSTP